MPPVISIIIPTIGTRMEYLEQAMLSVGDGYDGRVEVLISNNGAAPAVRALLQNRRYGWMKYVEWGQIMGMAPHWEACLRLATGRYVVILPDRSVLMAGAVSKLLAVVEKIAPNTSVTWSYDFFNPKEGVIRRSRLRPPRHYPSAEIRSILESGDIDDIYVPRGMNACVPVSILAEVRRRRQSVCLGMNPDYTLGFNVVAAGGDVYYCGESLYMSQGLADSNGIKGYIGSHEEYFKSVGYSKYANLSLPPVFVDASIYDDCISTYDALMVPMKITREFERRLGAKVVAEYMAKRMSGVLSRAELSRISAGVKSFLHERQLSLIGLADAFLVRELLRYGLRRAGRMAGPFARVAGWFARRRRRTESIGGRGVLCAAGHLAYCDREPQ